MSIKKWFALAVVLTGLVLLIVLVVQASPPGQQPGTQGGVRAQGSLGTGFTYQGQLKSGGDPVSEACDMAFRLYDQESGGSQVGSAITTTVPISDGLFTVSLDFGSGVFDGNARWLSIRVQCRGDVTYADLGRQALTAAPYATYALGAPWSGLTDVPPGFADGVDDDTTYSAGNQLDLVGTTFHVVGGAGSDLDADLLDGQHASEFVTEIAFEASDLHNMVTNASFEWFAGTVPDYWDLIEAGDPNVISQTVPGYDGAYAVRLTDATAAGFCIQQEVYADGALPDRLRGRLLTLSVWARQIDDMRPPGTISLSDGISRTAVLLENNTEWHRAVLTHQVQLSGTMLLVELCPVELAADTGAYDFDAVMLTVGLFDPLFAPGLRNTAWEIGGNAVDSAGILGTNNDQPLIIQTNGAEALRIDTDGRVGIGEASPGTYLLHVDSDGSYGTYSHGTYYAVYAEGGDYGVYGAGQYYGVSGYSWGGSGVGVRGYCHDGNGAEGESYNGNGVRGDSTYNDGVEGNSVYDSGVFGRSVNGYGVYGRSDNSTGVRGYGDPWNFYAAGPGGDYGPFTGAHEVRLADNFPIDIRPGMIVAATGEAQTSHTDEGEIDFSSTLPTVGLCSTPNDSRVLGVLIAEQSLDDEHWYTPGEGERFGIVNALGEGRVWVTNVNGDIHVGDYVTTSSIVGYGQRQDDDLLHSYTLGKAIEEVDWDTITETIEFDGQTYKVYPIAIVYTSG